MRAEPRYRFAGLLRRRGLDPTGMSQGEMLDLILATDPPDRWAFARKRLGGRLEDASDYLELKRAAERAKARYRERIAKQGKAEA